MDISIVECPRDAMQGIPVFIPTDKKVRYINQLLEIGFHTIDFGSFVSPKAIPQMSDTVQVLKGLDLGKTKSKLLAIVANTRGAKEAVVYDEIAYLGYPLSLSETFQQRNTNQSISEALRTVEEIQQLCEKYKKTLVVYLSMGFGNPYGDPYDSSVVGAFVGKLEQLNIKVISLADTIGIASPESIYEIFSSLIPAYPEIEFGAHFHSRPDNATQKIESAFYAGCRRFDGALKGYGGCPMAKDDLVGNIPTEKLIAFLASQNLEEITNQKELNLALKMVEEIFQ